VGEDKEGPAGAGQSQQPRLNDADARKVVKQVAFLAPRARLLRYLPALLHLHVDCERWGGANVECRPNLDPCVGELIVRSDLMRFSFDCLLAASELCWNLPCIGKF
jgi:hypothetical protein